MLPSDWSLKSAGLDLRRIMSEVNQITTNWTKLDYIKNVSVNWLLWNFIPNVLYVVQDCIKMLIQICKTKIMICHIYLRAGFVATKTVTCTSSLGSQVSENWSFLRALFISKLQLSYSIREEHLFGRKRETDSWQKCTYLDTCTCTWIVSWRSLVSVLCTDNKVSLWFSMLWSLWFLLTYTTSERERERESFPKSRVCISKIAPEDGQMDPFPHSFFHMRSALSNLSLPDRKHCWTWSLQNAWTASSPQPWVWHSDGLAGEQ